MKTVNKVTLIGHLGRDVELRYMPSGDAVANIAIATSSEWRDRDSGDKQQSTEWHRCVAFAKLAELIAEYCKKGSYVYFEGRLKTRKWQDKDGVDQYTTEVVIEEFINLEKRQAEQAQSNQAEPAPAAKKAAGSKARK